ncbi:MAG TPA: hypothetical protein VGD87_06660 [Archangium sp.]
MATKKQDSVVKRAALMLRNKDIEPSELEPIWEAMTEKQREQLGRSIRSWADGREQLAKKKKAELELDRSKLLVSFLAAMVLGVEEGEAVHAFLKKRTQKIVLPDDNVETRATLVAALLDYYANRRALRKGEKA